MITIDFDYCGRDASDCWLCITIDLAAAQRGYIAGHAK